MFIILREYRSLLRIWLVSAPWFLRVTTVYRIRW